MAYDTGLGATLTLTGYTAATSPLISISFDEQSRDSISVATLADTGFDPQIPADLAGAGGFTATIQFDPTDTFPLVTGAAMDKAACKVTWPASAGGTNAYLYGDGFVTGFTYPELAIDTVQEATITVQFDGIDGPTWSAEA